MKLRFKIISGLVSLMTVSACGSTGGAGTSEAVANSGNGVSNRGGVPSAPALGTSCRSDDPNFLCLAVKYVTYVNSSNTPTVNEAQTATNIEDINNVWKQCKIGFEVEKYMPIRPSDSGLQYNTANASELSKVRDTFEDDSTLLVVTTGSWNREGTLGNTGANAWTSMPGEALYGVVLESAVAGFGNIIGHELGHYLNLDHVSNTSNLMNPVIYDSSVNLTSNQCSAAKEAVSKYWQNMKRS